MEKLFLGFYDRYSSVVNENMPSNGKAMKVRKVFNPLTPRSDQFINSYYILYTLSSRQVNEN